MKEKEDSIDVSLGPSLCLPEHESLLPYSGVWNKGWASGGVERSGRWLYESILPYRICLMVCLCWNFPPLRWFIATMYWYNEILRPKPYWEWLAQKHGTKPPWQLAPASCFLLHIGTLNIYTGSSCFTQMPPSQGMQLDSSVNLSQTLSSHCLRRKGKTPGHSLPSSRPV